MFSNWKMSLYQYPELQICCISECQDIYQVSCMTRFPFHKNETEVVQASTVKFYYEDHFAGKVVLLAEWS